MANFFLTIKNLTLQYSTRNTRQAIQHTIALPVLGLTLLTILYLLNNNQNVFLALNQISLFTGESLWAYLTLLGDPVVLLCIGLALYSIAPQISFSLLPTLVVGGISVFYFKWLFGVDRPPGVLSDIVVIGQPPISGAFPSGHTTGVFAMAALLMLLTKNHKVKLLLLAIALLVGFSRIAVGAHWPMDVSAGIVLGWLCAIIGVKISKGWQPSEQKARAINLLLIITAIYLFFRNTGYAQAYFMQFAIAASCLSISTISLLKLKAANARS